MPKCRQSSSMTMEAMLDFVLLVVSLLNVAMGVFGDEIIEVENTIKLTDQLVKSWRIQSTDFVIDLDSISDEVFQSINNNVLQTNIIKNFRIINHDYELPGDSLTRDHLTVISSKSWRATNKTNFSGAWLIPSTVNFEPNQLRYDSLIYKYDTDQTLSLYGNISVSEIYTFKQGSGIVHKADIGYMNTDLGEFTYTADEFIWERRCDLEGIQLTAVFNEYQPLSYHLPDGTLGGAFVDFANVFADSMNFTLNFANQPDGKWGSKKEDGSWSGMVGSLVEEKADLALSGLRVSQVLKKYSYSKDAIDFVEGTYQMLITLMAHDSSKGTAISLTRYFEAFSIKAWTAIAAIIVSLSVTFYMTHKQEPIDDEVLVTSFSYLESLSLVFHMVIFQRDFNFNANPNHSCRLTFFITCLFGFLFFASYSALLTATMMGYDSELNVETFADLAKSDLKLYLWEDSSTYDSFRVADENSDRGLVYRTMIDGQLEDIFIGSNSEIYSKLALEPKSVFIDWDTILALYPDMYAVRSFRDFTPAQVSIGLQKNSEYREALNYHLRKMDQAGIRGKLLRNHGIRLEFSVQESEFEANPLGYDNLLFPALVVVVGGITSVILGMVEQLGFCLLQRDMRV